MRIISLLIIFCVLSQVCSAKVITSYWQVKKSQHFIVYYRDIPVGYVNDIIDKAENYYNSIADNLGFTRYDEFWTWDKRCKINIYSSMKEYQEATGQPYWSEGDVSISKRVINTFLYEKDFVNTILPHELGHLVFREFVGYRVKLPLWVDEGVACLQEKAFLEKRLRVAKNLVINELYLPLEKLSKINKENMVMPSVFYAESASVVNFLLKKYGKDKFVEFCQRLRDLRLSRDWFEAVRETYGFKDLGEMNETWVEWLKK